MLLKILLKPNAPDALALHIQRGYVQLDSKCNKCAKVGNWTKTCKSRLGKTVAEMKLTEDQYDDELFRGEITEVDAISGGAKESWKATVKLNRPLAEFKVDTGADVTVIPPNIFNKLEPLPEPARTTKLLMGPCKHELKVLGTFTAVLQE